MARGAADDRIMTRGTFANVRFKNKMADGKEGGFTKLMPEANLMDIHDACQAYRERGESLIVIAGEDYGMGSSRDWAAKGTALLGVKAVVAKSFEPSIAATLLGWASCRCNSPMESTIPPLALTGDKPSPSTDSVMPFCGAAPATHDSTS